MTNFCIVELTAALHGALSDIEGLVDETCADRLQWLAISPRLRNAYRRRLTAVRNRLSDVVRQLDDIDESGDA